MGATSQRSQAASAAIAVGAVVAVALLFVLAGVDNVEVWGTLLFAPVFLVAVFAGRTVGFAAAGAAALAYLLLRLGDLDDSGALPVALLVVARGAGYVGVVAAVPWLQERFPALSAPPRGSAGRHRAAVEEVVVEPYSPIRPRDPEPDQWSAPPEAPPWGEPAEPVPAQPEYAGWGPPPEPPPPEPVHAGAMGSTGWSTPPEPDPWAAPPPQAVPEPDRWAGAPPAPGPESPWVRSPEPVAEAAPTTWDDGGWDTTPDRWDNGVYQPDAPAPSSASRWDPYVPPAPTVPTGWVDDATVPLGDETIPLGYTGELFVPKELREHPLAAMSNGNGHGNGRAHGYVPAEAGASTGSPPAAAAEASAEPGPEGVDPETRLWNARYFRDRLSDAYDAARRSPGSPFSVVMIQVPDEPFQALPYRRQVAVLRELGHQFIQARMIDHLVHLPDGAQHWFAVVLPDADRATAHNLERRLRGAITAYLRSRGLQMGEIQSASLTSPDDDAAMGAVWSSLLGPTSVR